MLHNLRRVGDLFFQLVPDRLGRGKGVVTIAHGIEHHLTGNLVLGLKSHRISQGFQRRSNALDQFRPVDSVALQVPTVRQQFKIVNRP